MVMTNRTKPRLSILGAACALCLAAAGWLAAPLLACPPDSDARTAPAGVLKLRAPRAAVAIPRGSAQPPRAPDETTFESYMTQREHRGEELAEIAEMQGEGDLRARIDDLERRLERLSKQLEQIVGQQQGGGGGLGGGGGMSGGKFRAISPVPPLPAQAPSAPSGVAVRSGGVTAPGFSGTVIAQGNPDGQAVTRFYKLSSGKREAFYQFMARSDVPLVVSQAKDGINIQATPQQHEVIRMFMDMIEPGSRNRADSAGAHALPEIQRMNELATTYEAVARNAEAQRAAAAAELQVRFAGASQRAMIERSEQIRRQAEEMRKLSEQQQRQAEEMKAKAQSMQDGVEKLRLVEMVAALIQQSHELQEQALVHDAQADEIDAVADSIDENADSNPIDDDEDGESDTAR